MARVEHIIEALGRHEDSDAIRVLENVGTNCPNDEIRELTSKALIQRNSHDSLRVVILSRGKGINDLNSKVAMAAINEILELKDQDEALKILNDTIEMHSDDEVRETAKSVKTLMELSL